MILALLGTGTAVTAAALLSGGFRTDKLVVGFAQFARWRVRQALSRLKIQEMIQFDARDLERPIVLTPQGLKRVREQELRLLSPRKPKRWDHLWRVLVFDIPERTGLRAHFQRRLQESGWYGFQESIYVHPHEEQARYSRELALINKLSRHVTVFTVPDLGPFEEKVRHFFFKDEANKKSL